MKLGIAGLPNVGKSTLFNALTKGKALIANYPFTTIEPNVGIVAIPDKRLAFLADLFQKKKVNAAVEFFDIAGLVKGASKGEGLGNKFLGNIRECEAIVEVVRCFEDKNVSHIMGQIDPLRDIEIISTELILADLETIQTRLEKLNRSVKSGDHKILVEDEFAKRLDKHLESGNPARTFAVKEEEKEFFKEYFLLTAKPILYVCNVDETFFPAMKNNFFDKITQLAKEKGGEAVPISAKMEDELQELNESDQLSFLKDFGLEESGLNRLIHSSYSLLNLLTFYTVIREECHAWTVEKDTHAPQAAGKIHTDFEKGFIKAEVMHFDDFKKLGSHNAVKDAGLVHIEGRDYIVKDGDIIEFKFHIAKE
ncbi:MAG: redox-regulated ATPase YchF [Elusimicrobia bacterium]|nr:redox-regulated ATPase YchF [Elusimicrobiota bacterium]